jgi:hypothetical protein
LLLLANSTSHTLPALLSKNKIYDSMEECAVPKDNNTTFDVRIVLSWAFFENRRGRLYGRIEKFTFSILMCLALDFARSIKIFLGSASSVYFLNPRILYFQKRGKKYAMGECAALKITWAIRM